MAMEDFERTHARNSDPVTSRKAARKASRRAGSLSMLALDAIASQDPRPTGYERVCKLLDWNPLTGRWKRISDLKVDGLIYVAGFEINSIGNEVGTYRLTEAGWAEHRRLFDYGSR